MSLMIEVDRFLRHSGMAQTRFGRIALNDPRLVGDMRRGRQLGPRNQARVRDAIRREQRS